MSELEDLKIENQRMLTAMERIANIATDMLDPVRRRGPTGGVDEEETIIKDPPF